MHESLAISSVPLSNHPVASERVSRDLFCVSVCESMCAWARVCIHACMYMYIHVHVHVHLCVYEFVSIRHTHLQTHATHTKTQRTITNKRTNIQALWRVCWECVSSIRKDGRNTFSHAFRTHSHTHSERILTHIQNVSLPSAKPLHMWVSVVVPLYILSLGAFPCVCICVLSDCWECGPSSIRKRIASTSSVASTCKRQCLSTCPKAVAKPLC